MIIMFYLKVTSLSNTGDYLIGDIIHIGGNDTSDGTNGYGYVCIDEGNLNSFKIKTSI